MCGIVGIISKDPRGLFSFHGELFKEFLYANAVRGFDSTGVFGITLKNELELAKQAVDPGIFFRTKASKDWFEHIPNFRVIVGHNRKATIGSVSSENAHPFREGNIVLVHNGSVFDHKSLGKETDVDSHALCHAFAANGAEKTIANVRGMFALVWYDLAEKALYFWRNKERPLELLETSTDIYLASEKTMLKWILTRDSRVLGTTESQYRSVPVDTLVKMTFNPWKVETKTLQEKEWVYSSGQGNWYPVKQTPMSQLLDYSNNDSQSCEFEPEWVKHVKDVKRQNNSEIKPDLYTAKDAIALYPFDSEALFKYKTIRSFTEQPKRWEIEGEIYLPNKPAFKCLIYTEAGVELSQLKKWKDTHKLLTKVKTVLKIQDHIVIHGNGLTIPQNVRTHNQTWLPELEWKIICHTFKCAKCNSPISENVSSLTSVNEKDNKLGIYKIVCSECTQKAIPENKRAIIQSSDTTVQNRQPFC